MKIDKLEIKNFRTLENVTLTFDGYFASVSGRNNAGKTSVIKCIRSLFKGQEKAFSLFDYEDSISYTASKTQWVSNNSPIEFGYYLTASKEADPGLYSFVKKIAGIDDLSDNFQLEVNVKIKEKEEKEISILINGQVLKKYETGEIYQRLSSSNTVFLHNSTGGGNKIYYPSGAKSFHEMMLSKDEKEDLKREQERIRKKVKKFASEHRGELSGLLVFRLVNS